MKPKPTALILLLLLSLAAVTFIVARAKRTTATSGFTMQITINDYPADGREPILSASKIRYQKADGNWRMETTYPNGHTDVGFGQVGRGVFHVDENKQRLDYLSGLSGERPADLKLRSLPGFVGEERLLGFNTFHFHTVSSDTGEITDSYICPALQALPLKIISTFKNGAKNVYEVTQVIKGEPPDSVFTSLPKYPVDMTHYEQVHGPAPPSVQISK
jgi:hypothetical protein